jgi:ribosomal protein S18 acetylase RimI-like enzyme
MGSRVIQGFFVGGAMRPQPAPRAAAARAGPSHSTGAPPLAFAGRAAPLQARMAPGRPPLAHQGAGHVAQRHGGDGSFAIDPVQIGLARGGGKPLPPALLAKMESALGADFSAVRVHVGPQAARIGAIAFTTGNDLYFAPGQFQPDSVQGQQLIGHELAHVVQQRQGRVRAPGAGMAVVQDRALEAEADRLGMRAAAHRPPVQAKMAGAGGPPVHISAQGGTASGSHRLTAGSGANPIGSLVVHTGRGAAAEVTDLGVAAGHRDQGIGRQLLESAARAGLRSGNSKLSLSAQDNGSGKLTRWYKDMGFQQVGVNGRGMPVLEAPISRLLAGAVQPKLDPATAVSRPAQPPWPPRKPNPGRGPIQRAAPAAAAAAAAAPTKTLAGASITGYATGQHVNGGPLTASLDGQSYKPKGKQHAEKQICIEAQTVYNKATKGGKQGSLAPMAISLNAWPCDRCDTLMMNTAKGCRTTITVTVTGDNSGCAADHGAAPGSTATITYP